MLIAPAAALDTHQGSVVQQRRCVLHAPGRPQRLLLSGIGERHAEVGTVAQHHELGPIALALIKRSVPLDAELTAGETQASIDPDSVPPDTPAAPTAPQPPYGPWGVPARGSVVLGR